MFHGSISLDGRRKSLAYPQDEPGATGPEGPWGTVDDLQHQAQHFTALEFALADDAAVDHRGGIRAGLGTGQAKTGNIAAIGDALRVQMAGHAKYQRQRLARGPAVRLYIALTGCFAFGLCELPHCMQSSNPVIAACKPPSLRVIAYGPPSGLPPPPDVAIPKPIATANSLT